MLGESPFSTTHTMMNMKENSKESTKWNTKIYMIPSTWGTSTVCTQVLLWGRKESTKATVLMADSIYSSTQLGLK
jgi:hypothetical protein